MAKLFAQDDEAREKTGNGQKKGVPFFPDFALREALAAATFLVVLLLITIFTRPPLEEVADPNASGYIPRPEWYFLWFFQSLKYFRGELEIVGLFVLPTVGIGLLLAVPFLDRREARPRRLLPRTRPIRVWPRLVGAAAMTGIIGLTLVAMTSDAHVLQPESTLTPVQAAGQVVFEKMGCSSCHVIAGEGGTKGPDLTSFGAGPDAEQRVLLHFGAGGAEGSIMPGYQLSTEELRSLAAYLLSLKGE